MKNLNNATAILGNSQVEMITPNPTDIWGWSNGYHSDKDGVQSLQNWPHTSVESKGCSGRPSTSQNEIIINQLGTLPMQYIESQSENLQTRWVSALDPFIPWGRRIWYCFIPEGLLNPVDHFHLRTVKLYTKLDAVILFEIFHYFSKNKYWTGLVCMSLLTNSLLSLTASPGGKKSTRALGLLT